MNSIFDAIESQNHTQLAKLAINSSVLILRNEKGFEPLPLCARSGWVEGIQILSAAGADINRADKDPSHFKEFGPTPLALAIRSGKMEAAQELLNLGACIKNRDDELLLALCFLSRHYGWETALDFFKPIEAAGFRPICPGNTSCWLSLNVCSGIKNEEDRTAIEQWILKQLGSLESQDQNNACFHYLMAAVSEPWVPQSVLKLFARSTETLTDPLFKRASFLLSEGFEYGQSDYVKIACERLVEIKKESHILSILSKVAAKIPSMEQLESTEFVKNQKKAVLTAFSCCPSLCSASSLKEILPKIGAEAFIHSRAGFIAALLELGVPGQEGKKWLAQSERSFHSISKTIRNIMLIECAASTLISEGEEATKSFWQTCYPYIDNKDKELLFVKTEQILLDRQVQRSLSPPPRSTPRI